MKLSETKINNLIESVIKEWSDSQEEPQASQPTVPRQKKTIYSKDDKLELVDDPNIHDGGNFPFKRNGKLYWYSRSNTISLYVYCVNPRGDWCVLGSVRGPGAQNDVGKWNVVCGFLDHGESLESTAVRECWEETGVVIDESMLRCLGTNSSRLYGNVSTSFCVFLDGDTSQYPTSMNNCEPGEVSKVGWVPLKYVSKLKWAGRQGGNAIGIFKSYGNVGNIRGHVGAVKVELIKMLQAGEINKQRYKKIMDLLK